MFYIFQIVFAGLSFAVVWDISSSCDIHEPENSIRDEFKDFLFGNPSDSIGKNPNNSSNLVKLEFSFAGRTGSEENDSSADERVLLISINTLNSSYNQHPVEHHYSLMLSPHDILSPSMTMVFPPGTTSSIHGSFEQSFYVGDVMNPDGTVIGRATITHDGIENTFEGLLMIEGRTALFLTPAWTERHGNQEIGPGFNENSIHLLSERSGVTRHTCSHNDSKLRHGQTENGVASEEIEHGTNSIEMSTSQLLRTKREATTDTKKLIELAVFIDTHMMKELIKRLENDDKRIAKEQADIDKTANYKAMLKSLTVAAGLNMIFNDGALKHEIELRIVHVEILGSSNHPQIDELPKKGSSNYFDKAKAYYHNYHKEFCFWQQKQVDQSKNMKWDHATLFSGINSALDFVSVQGVAYLGGMCSSTTNCSMVNGMSLGVAFVLSHEIGHSLGFPHDGHGNYPDPSRKPDRNDCNQSTFIMTGSGFGNIFSTFSECSYKFFVDNVKLKRLPCLEETTVIEKEKYYEGLVYKWTNDRFAGQAVDTDEQCKLVFGALFRVSSEMEHQKSICERLHCLRLQDDAAFTRFPALEGTTCAEGKVCMAKKCVRRPLADAAQAADDASESEVGQKNETPDEIEKIHHPFIPAVPGLEITNEYYFVGQSDL